MLVLLTRGSSSGNLYATSLLLNNTCKPAWKNKQKSISTTANHLEKSPKYSLNFGTNFFGPSLWETIPL